jgi:hypothetical protein
MSARANGSRLWSIRGPGTDVLFVGTLRQAVDEVGRLDRLRGIGHAAIELRR